MSVITALSMTITTIVLAYYRCLCGEEESPADSGSPTDEGTFEKWLNRQADVLKRLARTVAESSNIWGYLGQFGSKFPNFSPLKKP